MVQCLKMYQFKKYNEWLKTYNILFHCHLRLETLYTMNLRSQIWPYKHLNIFSTLLSADGATRFLEFF
jgi:hypothetical protein